MTGDSAPTSPGSVIVNTSAPVRATRVAHEDGEVGVHDADLGVHDADPGVHDADSGVHDADLAVHDGPIWTFTIDRFSHHFRETPWISNNRGF